MNLREIMRMNLSMWDGARSSLSIDVSVDVSLKNNDPSLQQACWRKASQFDALGLWESVVSIPRSSRGQLL